MFVFPSAADKSGKKKEPGSNDTELLWQGHLGECRTERRPKLVQSADAARLGKAPRGPRRRKELWIVRVLEYERARLVRGRIDVWGKRAQVMSCLGDVTPHAHAVGTLLVALDGAFELRTRRRPWTNAKAVYLPPGCQHALRVHGQRLACIFLAPGKVELEAFARAQNLCPWRVHLLTQLAGLQSYVTACWETRICSSDIQQELAKLVGGFAPARLCEDPRVSQIVENLRSEPARSFSARARAELLGVQGSRAREIVRDHLGVSWQSVRRWERMRALSGLLAQGQSLTRAAHALGFSDSSQLTRDFRASFGVAPGKLFRGAQLVIHFDHS